MSMLPIGAPPPSGSRKGPFIESRLLLESSHPAENRAPGWNVVRYYPSNGSDHFGRASLGGALALGLVEQLLAQAQVFGRSLDIFVRSNVLEGAFERHFKRRIELDALAVTL